MNIQEKESEEDVYSIASNEKKKFINKKSRLIENLKTNERVHTREKSHVCKTCNEAFKRKDHLTRHVRLVH